MQNAATVLSVLRRRGQRGLPLERLYRQLFNPDLYLRAYARLYPNQGAMTPGVTPETVDGMARQKITRLIEAVRAERFRWTPVRRTYIPKKNGKLRPLGLPTWRDKLLQEVIRSLLEAYFEPQFAAASHGFRPGRGCHTALTTIAQTWKGTKWFIEGDIQGCFDQIDHPVLLSILREKIHDNRFLRLIENLLKAGYLEHWRYHRTVSGTPQGGVISPLLANLYLNRLDQYVDQTLLREYNRGTRRRKNPAYRRISDQVAQCRKTGRGEEAKRLGQQQRQLPSYDPADPGYRRLRYCRYADDFLLGFAGPKAEARQIKEQLATFLRAQLKLELSPEKTLITHATTQAARFLGYELVSQHCDTRLDRQRCRSINGVVGLRLPAAVVEKRCALYQRNGKPHHRTELLHDSDYTIVVLYQSEYRGFVQYYALAQNRAWLDRLRWVMETSLLKTLAAKHRTSVAKIRRKLQTTVSTEAGPRRCLEVQQPRPGRPPLIARFGGLSLARQRQAHLPDPPTGRYRPRRSELLQRLLAEECELCQSREQVQVHHIRKLADLQRPGRRAKPGWAQVMAARQRKTLVVCGACHAAIHAGKPPRQPPAE
jgi:group II intron reverse transcriptase/maturase